MKKLFFLVSLVLMVGGVSVGSYFFGDLSAGIENEFAGDDPDMPSTFQTGMSKEEFMIKRAEFIAELRGVEEDKPFNPQLRIDAVQKLEKQESAVEQMPDSSEKDSVSVGWTEIGPNPIPNGQTQGNIQLPVSGRTIAIAVHPTNPNIVYVGTAQGGLYRTTNGGATWIPMLDNALSLAVGAVAIAPSQPDTVYVGTGEPNFSADSFFGVGVYRIDNASTANPVVTGPLNKNSANADIFSGCGIGKIIVHPTNPDIIFVGSTSGGGGIGYATPSVLPNRGIYRSTNATSTNPTFEQLASPFTNQNLSIRDLAIDPADPNILVANIVANGGGIIRSANALAANPTFTLVSTFTGTSISNLTAEFAAIHPAGDANATFYAAAGNNTAGTGTGSVLKSTDGGVSFTQINSTAFCGGQCFYDIAVAVDPTNINNVYIGGTGNNYTFGASTDGGTSFTARQNGLHTDSHVIAVAPSAPSTIYFGSDGGIYKSFDSGANWTSLNNTTFRATQFISVAVHPTDPNFTIGGTQDNGTEYRNPAGDWTRADFGDGGYSLIDQSSTNTTVTNIYHTYYNDATLQGYGYVPGSAAATEGNWSFRGCNNNVAGNGIPCGGAVLFYAPIEQGPGSPNTVYYGANILYRSANTGLLHTAVSQNLTNPISAIGISPQNDNVRIVGQNNGGIFGTTTGSTTLTNLDAGNAVPNNFVARAVVDPNNVNTAYVTLSAFGITSIWKTTNLDSATPTWTAAAGSGVKAVPQVPVNAFIVDPLDSNRLYAGTDIGVYTSPNGGATWTPFGTGLPRVAVFDMAITAGRLVRIATHGRGMWEISAIAQVLGLEADVASRPNGDGVIQSNDVVQIRRFLNELDTFNTSTNEFQRADSAPRASRGDGVINSADVVQTIRYLNEVDAAQAANGPATNSGEKSLSITKSVSSGGVKEVGRVTAPSVAPELRVESASGSAGNQVTVNIRVDAVGNEAQYGFAVLFDPNVLSYTSFAAGETGSRSFSCNATMTAGQVHCAIGDFPRNQAGSSTATIGEIDPGNDQLLVKVIFTVNANAQSNTTTAVSLNSQSASDDNANGITPAVTNGTVTIAGATAAAVSVSGKVTTADGRGIRNVQITLTDASGRTRTALTTAFGYYRFAEVAAGASYIIRAKAKRYTFNQATRVLNLNADTDEVNFIADDL